jgi:hypothetical protein
MKAKPLVPAVDPCPQMHTAEQGDPVEPQGAQGEAGLSQPIPGDNCGVMPTGSGPTFARALVVPPYRHTGRRPQHRGGA